MKSVIRCMCEVLKSKLKRVCWIIAASCTVLLPCTRYCMQIFYEETNFQFWFRVMLCMGLVQFRLDQLRARLQDDLD